MRAIRHYLFVLVGGIILSFFTGIAAAVWVIIMLAIAVMANKLPRIITIMERHIRDDWALRLLYVVTVLSFAIALAGGVFIFIWYGWVATVGYVILFLGYFGVREDSNARSERAVAKVRESLREIIAAQAAGKLTREQMEHRFFRILEQDLIADAYNLTFLAKQFLAEDGMSQNEYLTYLKLLEQHLSRIERHHVFSPLHRNVRIRLGLSAF
jgi:hypothetical protein